MNKVYVRWNPLHERVVCVHSSEELECFNAPHTEIEFEELRKTVLEIINQNNSN